MRWLLLASTLLAGCSMSDSKSPAVPEAPIPGIDTPAPLDPVDALLLDGELPDPNDPASMEPRYAPERTITGIYRVEERPGSKMLQAVTIEGDDGRTYVHAYRAIPEEMHFKDKRVVVVGRPYVNSPYVQSVTGLHIEAKSITLAAP